jgi:16S rRNA (uracil1498-N3)-methyltransferase
VKLKRFFVTKEELETKHISSEESFHAITVLRLKEGDKISLFNNDEFDYIAEITYMTKFGINFEITKKEKNISNPKISITVFQALAKGDKLEMVVQKSTELGALEFVPFYSLNCDVKPNTTKIDRLQKIMINACKQCGRSILMNINNVVDINDIIKLSKDFDIMFFANETQQNNYISTYLNKRVKNIAIIVGPEGGFTQEEIQKLSQIKNVESVSLGKRILRTETAGLYMLSIINELTNN